jgi:hypothetical protein
VRLRRRGRTRTGPEVSAHVGADSDTGEFATHRVGGAAFEPLNQDGNRQRVRVGDLLVHVVGFPHQMRVRQRHAVADAARGLGCHRSVLQSVHADALPLPHRTDTAPAADAGAGVRVRPSGLQRRIAGPRRRTPSSEPGCARCPVWRWCSRSMIRVGLGATSSTQRPGNAKVAK